MQEVDIAAVIVTYQCAALTVDCLRSVASDRSETEHLHPRLHYRQRLGRFGFYRSDNRIMTYGVSRAIAIDIAALIANSMGLIKRMARRRNRPVPHYIRDLVRHSVLWPKNRNLSALRSFRPPRSQI
jgi:hypothetical protein